jgi:hypothetical protein
MAFAKGLLLSVIPLWVFADLFTSADPIYARDWDHLFDWHINWNVPGVVEWAAWAILFGWTGAGMLRTALLRKVAADRPTDTNSTITSWNSAIAPVLNSQDIVVA